MLQIKDLFRMSVVVGALLAISACTPQNNINFAQNVVGPRKIIALVPDTQSAIDVRDVAISGGYQLLDTAQLSGLDLTMLTFIMPDGVTGPEAIAALEGAVPGSTVGINHAYRTTQQGSENAAELDYANDMMGWNEKGCRALVPVGVIDTGIDTTAPGLANASIVTQSFFSGEPAPAKHGTDVASILASPNRLRDVNIYGANVFGQQDELGLKAGADGLVRALDWLAEQDVRFVNLALTGPYNKLLDLAVERATQSGLILIAAVGNDGPEVEPLYPAAFEDVIAVTAVDADGQLFRNAVRGPHVDIAAPGVDVLIQSDDGVRFVTGTSMATPFVTARLVADPSLVTARDVTDVRARLAGTSAELGAKGRDTMFGYGLASAHGICG